MKKIYERPDIETVSFKQASIICTSFNDPEWGKCQTCNRYPSCTLHEKKTNDGCSWWDDMYKSFWD